MDTTQDARQLLIRGKPAARKQCKSECAVHNLLKLHRNGPRADPHRISAPQSTPQPLRAAPVRPLIAAPQRNRRGQHRDRSHPASGGVLARTSEAPVLAVACSPQPRGDRRSLDQRAASWVGSARWLGSLLVRAPVGESGVLRSFHIITPDWSTVARELALRPGFLSQARIPLTARPQL